jgi:hypothetical protein
MLPDLRFAIGAVLASALLIVTAFGLAATVRIAHHRTEGPLEAPRILAYSDPMDWGPRPDALRRLDDLRINDSLLERLAAIPADPAPLAPSTTAPTAAPEPASEPVVVALPVEAVAPASVLPEAPNAALSAATPAAVAETPVAAAPAQVVADVAPDVAPAAVAEIPAAQIPEAKPVETQRAVPDRMTVALATIDIAAKADAGFAALLQAAVRPPAKKAAPTVKKKVAKRRRVRRTVVREPTASTGYPVTSSTNSLGNNGFGRNNFDTNKYLGDN